MEFLVVFLIIAWDYIRSSVNDKITVIELQIKNIFYTIQNFKH